MSNGSYETLRVGSPPNMDAERSVLSRARAELARGELADAEASLRQLLESRPEIASRARVQLALVRHRKGEPAVAKMLLDEATEQTVGLLVSCGERLEGDSDRAVGELAAEKDPDTMGGRATLLELGRAWARLGHPKQARETYTRLVKEADVNHTHTAAGRHIVALAEYRLGELVVDEEPSEACAHWQRCFNTGDEQVSPYAALRLATEVDDELVKGRVERLLHHAMGSSDPQLFAEAALALGRHLWGKRQPSEARRYLRLVAEQTANPARAREAEQHLSEIEWEEASEPQRAGHLRMREVKDRAERASAEGPSPRRKVVVVGAGTGGDYLVESLSGSPNYLIIGFVDDKVVGSVGDGSGGRSWPVFGGLDQLTQIIRERRPDEVLLAIPTLAGSRRRVVVKACRDTSTPLLNLPRMHELGIGWGLKETRRRLMTQLRRVEIEELLGERRVEIDSEATAWLQYETAVVVGAGALGAEICRRLADGDVGRVIVIDRRPSALRKIVGELADLREFTGIEPLVGDATDSGWLAQTFRKCSPAAVINTTGHSPVIPSVRSGPLSNPDGGRSVVRNEVLAASAVASAAAHTGVPRMTHVSSRRVGVCAEPFEAMKALSEEVVLWHAATNPGAVQAVVRVGQLLDSRHGKLARLKQQIDTGARVRIPSSGAGVPFLSTARWAELVLHTTRLAPNGALLEPDCGEEIDVRDVAEQAIRLRGLHPGEHVLIEECESEHWDDPVSPERRRSLNRGLGIYRLVRPPATDESLEEALKTCAALVGEYEEDGLTVGEEDALESRPEI